MKQILLFLLICCKSILPAQEQVIGKWISSDQEGITQIYEKEGKYYGKITWLKKPKDENGVPFTDTQNPEKSMREQPLLELVILKDFYYNNKEYKGGTVYDPNTGKTYSCKMWLSDENTINIRGYWGFFYKTEKWTKIK